MESESEPPTLERESFVHNKTDLGPCGILGGFIRNHENTESSAHVFELPSRRGLFLI